MFPPPITTDCAPLSPQKRSLLFRQSLSANLSSSHVKSNIYTQLSLNQTINDNRTRTPSYQKQQLQLRRQRAAGTTSKLAPQKSLATQKSSISMNEFDSTFDNSKNNNNPSIQQSQNTGGHNTIDPFEHEKAGKLRSAEWLKTISVPRMVRQKQRRPKLEEILGGDPNSRYTGTAFAKNRPSTTPSTNNSGLEEKSSIFTNTNNSTNSAGTSSRGRTGSRQGSRHGSRLITTSLSRGSRDRAGSHFDSSLMSGYRGKIDLSAQSDNIRAMSLYNNYEMGRVRRSEEEIMKIRYAAERAKRARPFEHPQRSPRTLRTPRRGHHTFITHAQRVVIVLSSNSLHEQHQAP